MTREDELQKFESYIREGHRKFLNLGSGEVELGEADRYMARQVVENTERFVYDGKLDSLIIYIASLVGADGTLAVAYRIDPDARLDHVSLRLALVDGDRMVPFGVHTFDAREPDGLKRAIDRVHEAAYAVAEAANSLL